MSHVDSKDDDVKSILAQIDSDDSKESDLPPKPKEEEHKKNDDYNEYEYSTDKDNPYHKKYDKNGSDNDW